MRKQVFRALGPAAFALAAGWLASGAAFAQLPKAVTPYVPSETELTPIVAPGDQIAISCRPVEQRSAESDVRVVLTISAEPGESPPGYKKVLATDAQLLKDAVRVRIPEIPDIDEHTVDLNVYVVDDKGSQRCEAGHVKIS